jgi:hypothetical protein
MSDVFISYAREDLQFVRRLHQSLQSYDRNTWIDWEGIAPSADWLQEIYSAIEGADTVVFVISDHSVTSQICSNEIQHAIENNKRIVPLLRTEVDDNLLPKVVRERNWIFFRENDSFDLAFNLLVKAIDTDLDWVKFHTRLLTRAIEWGHHNKDASFALHGSDLLKAESCLTLGREKEPELTVHQTEYIIASRRADTKRKAIIGTFG